MWAKTDENRGTTAMKNTAKVLLAAAVAASGTAWAGFRAEPLAAARDGETTFGVGVDFTSLEGKAREHVFAPAALSGDYTKEYPGASERENHRRHQISRLDWDMESVSMIGVKGSARRSILSLNLGAWGGASSVDDADMEDYDWLCGDHVGFSEYSRSDTELDEAWMLDANVSADLFRGEAVAAYAFVGWRVQHWEWTCDGWNEYRYSALGGKWARDKGHTCDYEQELRFGYFGVGGTWRLSDAFELGGYLSWAPGYEGEDHDEHLAAEKRFDEKFHYDDGDVYAAGLEVAWHVSERATLSLALDWQRATLHEGDMSLDNYGEGVKIAMKDAAGYENEYVTGTLAFKYAF
jgi:outer membrane protease